MYSKTENLFVVGPQATGDSFFGRSKELKDLETVFSSVSAVHLVGPTRIGKSSLVTQVLRKAICYPNCICITISMGECLSAYDFWKTFSNKIESLIREKALWDRIFEWHFTKIHQISSQSPEWFIDFKAPLQSILSNLKKANQKLVLVIDEFDSVDRVFEHTSHYFHLLRSVYSDPEYATSGVIISRRRLQLFEAKCEDISTYHGVFREMTLRAFNKQDMNYFYEGLSIYNIQLDDKAKGKFEHYTGCIPYLCSMLAARIVENVNPDDQTTEVLSETNIDDFFKECRPQIDQYYQDLIRRLEYDQHLELVCYLSLSTKLPNTISRRDIENLSTMGVLLKEEKTSGEGHNSAVQYYAYSKDFMTYFRLQPLKLPTWATMTQSEKKLKAIFKREYPETATITYDDLLADASNMLVSNLNTKYPELGLNVGKIKRFCDDLSAHKEHPTILDVLTLSEIVKTILSVWQTKFHLYFSGDESWKTKLEFIKNIRNPIAHAAIEYISVDELSTCMQYCDELIHLRY